MSDLFFPPRRVRTPPMSNAERQRRFRDRNPGYYGRLHRKRNAERDALAAEWAAAAQRAAAGQRPVLMLPAPVEVLELPGINAIPTTAELRERQAERAAR